jgi:hypothetical protein
MSRSKYKTTTNNSAFISCACYFSNKKDKRIVNRRFRRLNKILSHVTKHLNDYDDIKFYNKTKEISDVWDFSSDGLKYYIDISDWSSEDKRRVFNK